MELNHHFWSATATDYHHHQASDIVRSFKCSFCKRGFSNAQALGGHMNIHRKDRAKLRQLSNSNNHNDNDDDGDEIHVTHEEQNYHRIRRLKRSHNKGLENHHHNQLQQQLPIFIEATQWGGCSGHEEGLFPELDLELRLGPEPDHHRMAACLGTRNFF